MSLESNKMFLLGTLYETDKITHHKYHEIYPTYIEKFYNTTGGIIEIGIEQNKSLNMWMELFPNMHIYGIDISVEHSSDKHTIFKADQSSNDDLGNVLSKISHPIYFINDDGSHIPEHQLLTFNMLFPILEIGGVYIIEDVETSYWTKNGIYGYETRYGYKHPKSIVEIFKNVADCVNSEFAGEHENVVKHQKYIQSITFARNCIIIIKKDPDEREYRFKNNL